MTNYIPTIEMNKQDGYADIDFTNLVNEFRKSPSQLVMAVLAMLGVMMAFFELQIIVILPAVNAVMGGI